MTADNGKTSPAAPPAALDWQQWAETGRTDWRSWLQRLAATDWAGTDWGAIDWAGADRVGVPWARETGPGPAVGYPAKPDETVSLSLRSFGEDEPGPEMAAHLTAVWPAFGNWWREGANTRPTAAEARQRLEQHMPELVPVWERLASILGDDPGAAAALTLWNPPPFLTGCSQAAVLPGGPALIRNYDWDYRLFDAVVARTAYGGRRVLGMLDCLWGLVDGVNDAGLAVSLTFGGRPQVGEGFGIPLVIRYVLETCGTLEEAVRALRRIPVHMSYNVTVLSRDGQRATVYLAPDRPAHVTKRAAVTNHQEKVEWFPYAAAIRTVERLERLDEILESGADVSSVVAACLRPPLYATQFGAGFGTLYTAEYRPADGVARYHWPDRTWEHSLDELGSGGIRVQLGAAALGSSDEHHVPAGD